MVWTLLAVILVLIAVGVWFLFPTPVRRIKRKIWLLLTGISRLPGRGLKHAKDVPLLRRPAVLPPLQNRKALANYPSPFALFERALFAYTRGFVMLGTILALLGAFGAVVTLALTSATSYDTSVSYTDIAPPELPQKPDQAQARLAPPGLRAEPAEKEVPEYLKKYADRLDLDLIVQHASELTDGQRRDFYDNLRLIVQEAESKSASVPEIVYKYVSKKEERLKAAQAAKVESRVVLLSAAGALVFTGIWLAALSLILVLLAIERNTRKE